MQALRLDALEPSALAPLADEIRALGNRRTSLESAAQATCRLLYESLVVDGGAPGAALVRVYKTHPFHQLEPAQQEFARTLVQEPDERMRCLTLLGTVGDEDDWNDRKRSRGHQAIPLPSVDFVQRIPMVAQLITQLGLEVETVLRPPEHAAKLAQQRYDVFHVAEAAGSPYLPAQEDFVERYGIASAVGFGGILLNGDFYAAILFSKIPVAERDARTLKVLALPLRVALTPMIGRPVFDP